jgi:hypothetical protein
MGSRSGFDADLELDELLNVVDRGSGAVPVATRQSNAQTNLGIPGTLAAYVTLSGTQNITGAKTFTSPVAGTYTNASATPGTVREITGSMTTGVSFSSGNLVGTRGVVTITNGTTVGNASYLYGAQGKIISGTGTINAGSGHIAGVYGQIDLLGGTVTSGHIAAVIADVANVGSDGTKVDGIYVEQVTGTLMNSALKVISASTYLFDVADSGGTHWELATKPSVLAGCLKIKTSAGDMYLPLYSSPTGG